MQIWNSQWAVVKDIFWLKIWLKPQNGKKSVHRSINDEEREGREQNKDEEEKGEEEEEEQEKKKEEEEEEEEEEGGGGGGEWLWTQYLV